MVDMAGAAHAVEQIARDFGFASAESWIDELSASDEHKSALWLLAFASVGRGTQQDVARQSLAAVL